MTEPSQEKIRAQMRIFTKYLFEHIPAKYGIGVSWCEKHNRFLVNIWSEPGKGNIEPVFEGHFPWDRDPTHYEVFSKLIRNFLNDRRAPLPGQQLSNGTFTSDTSWGWRDPEEPEEYHPVNWDEELKTLTEEGP